MACITFIEKKNKWKHKKSLSKPKLKKKNITFKLYMYVYCHLHCCFKLQTKKKIDKINQEECLFKIIIIEQTTQKKQANLSTYLPIL